MLYLFCVFVVRCVLIIWFVFVKIRYLSNCFDDIGWFVYYDNGGCFKFWLNIFEGIEIY